MSHKSFFRTLCTLLASVLLFTACENTTETKQQQDAASKEAQDGILYHCDWTSETGEKLLVEFRVQDQSVTEILINGEQSTLLESKAVTVYHDRDSALAAFSDCLDQNYKNVRLDRIDPSAAPTQLGDYSTSAWVVMHDYTDKDGD